MEFPFLPKIGQDMKSKLREYCLKNQNPNRDWKNAELEPELHVGEIIDSIGLEEKLISDKNYVIQNIENLNDIEEEMYDIIYCEFKMTCYEAEMDEMEYRYETQTEGVYEPIHLDYCPDINTLQTKIFHDTRPLTERVD